MGFGRVDGEELWQMLVQVAAGMQYLHSKGIVHRDLKPGNILAQRSRVGGGVPSSARASYGRSTDSNAASNLSSSSRDPVSRAARAGNAAFAASAHVIPPQLGSDAGSKTTSALLSSKASNASSFLNSDKLHRHVVLHSDVHCSYKVCDFGLSRVLGVEKERVMESTMTAGIGTPEFMAPEILVGNQALLQKHPFACDVYSYAILAWQVLSGDKPYSEFKQLNMGRHQLMRNIARGLRPSIPGHDASSVHLRVPTPPPPETGEQKTAVVRWPPRMVDVLVKCWAAKPSERPDFQRLEAFFREYGKSGESGDGDGGSGSGSGVASKEFFFGVSPNLVARVQEKQEASQHTTPRFETDPGGLGGLTNTTSGPNVVTTSESNVSVQSGSASTATDENDHDAAE